MHQARLAAAALASALVCAAALGIAASRSPWGRALLPPHAPPSPHAPPWPHAPPLWAWAATAAAALGALCYAWLAARRPSELKVRVRNPNPNPNPDPDPNPSPNPNPYP